MSCSFLKLYLEGAMKNIDDLNAFSVHVGGCPACRGAVTEAGKGGHLPRYSPDKMGGGSGVDNMGRLEQFEAEIKRIGRELREAKHRFETFRLENRVKQRRLMVRIVAANPQPLTPADIHRELVRDGFPFLSEDQAHQEASVYQACRDLEELGEFKRASGRRLAYRAVPDADRKQETLDAFVKAWWDTYRSKPMRVRDLLQLVDALGTGLVPVDEDERARRIHLGLMLTRMRGQVFEQVEIKRIESGKHYRLWFLEKGHSPAGVSVRNKTHRRKG